MSRSDPEACVLYRAARGRATTRQCRLLMVAACRVRAAEFYDPRFASTLEYAERCADDPSAETEAQVRWNEIMTNAETPERVVGSHAVFEAWNLAMDVGNQAEDGQFSARRACLARAVLLSVRAQPGVILTGGDGDAVDYCLQALLERQSFERSQGTKGPERMPRVRATAAGIVRDILGEPSCSATFSPAWRTDTALALARQMYESREFGAMPILADALQDAGCDSDDILAHCRDASASHVRGCWVVDWVLGRSNGACESARVRTIA